MHVRDIILSIDELPTVVPWLMHDVQIQLNDNETQIKPNQGQIQPSEAQIQHKRHIYNPMKHRFSPMRNKYILLFIASFQAKTTNLPTRP